MSSAHINANKSLRFMNNIKLSVQLSSLETSIFVNILQIVFINAMPLKLFGSFYGHIIHLPHESGILPLEKILLKTFKKGSMCSIVHLYSSIHTPSGPGDLIKCKCDKLRIISSSVIISFNSELSLFCRILAYKLDNRLVHLYQTYIFVAIGYSIYIKHIFVIIVYFTNIRLTFS